MELGLEGEALEVSSGTGQHVTFFAKVGVNDFGQIIFSNCNDERMNLAC